jgi:hypothetical protein
MPSSAPQIPAELTKPMRYLLWQVGQHKYGWTHVSRYGGALQTGDALVRRGLVEWGRNGREHTDPRIRATDAGRAEIERRWPVSPFVLGTYEPQPGGWSLPDGRTEGEANGIPLPDTTKEGTGGR